MKSLLSLLFLAVCLSQPAAAAQESYEQAIRDQYASLQEVAASDSPPDNDAIIRNTYPPLMDAFGGADEYLMLVEAAFAYREEDDFADAEYGDFDEDDSFRLRSTNEEISVGEVYEQGGELQALLTVRSTEVYAHEEESGYFRDDISTDYQLAISQDGGKHWYLLDSTVDWDSVVPELHPAISQRESTMETRFRNE